MCLEYDWPDTSSLAAVLEVRARHPSLPIILLTARTVSKSRIETLDQPTPRVGVWDHLLKPVSVTRFCECLTGLTRGPLPAAQPRGAVLAAGHALAARRTSTVGNLAPAVSYVAANYSEKLRLSTAAKLCDLSRFQFSRSFKKEQGLTFRDFVVQTRIQRAAELMRQSNALSVTEAAFVVGFNDLSHFSRMFRRQLGVTPSHYRRAENELSQLSLFVPGESKRR